MGEDEHSDDVVGGAEPVAHRWLFALGGLAVLFAVLALTRHGAPSNPNPNQTPTGAVERPTEVPLHAVSIRSDATIRALPGRRAALRVTVTNDNDVPLTLFRVGQAVSGLSLWSVEPTPQRLAPHGTATVVVTFVRYPALHCDSVGEAIAVVVTSADDAVHKWLLPLAVSGRPWDEALAAVACAGE